MIVDEGRGDLMEERGANGLRRSPLVDLTDDEIEFLKGEIRAIDADENVFRFNQGRTTGYHDDKDVITVRASVFPDEDSTHPRDIMSARAVLAHEYYGHRAYRGTNAEKDSWHDEFRASYMAAQNAPNLSKEDRMYLMRDALERAREAGVSIRHSDTIRRVLHGYRKKS